MSEQIKIPSLEFKGFDGFYESNIRPDLHDVLSNAKWANRNQKLLDLTCILIVCSILIGAIFVPYVLILFVALFWRGWSLEAYFYLQEQFVRKPRNSIADFHLKKICEFLDLNFVEDLAPKSKFYKWHQLNLIAYDPTLQAVGIIKGVHLGCDFSIYVSAHDLKNLQSEMNDVFIEITLKNKKLGRTIVLPDQGTFQAKSIQGLKRVGFADPEFERMYEAYGTDQVESRAYLTPDFMALIVDLQKCLRAASFRFGFLENKFVITFSSMKGGLSGTGFKIHSQREADSSIELTNRITTEFAYIFKLIDVLLDKMGSKYKGPNS